jgi:hypothetical protein
VSSVWQNVKKNLRTTLKITADLLKVNVKYLAFPSIISTKTHATAVECKWNTEDGCWSGRANNS